MTCGIVLASKSQIRSLLLEKVGIEFNTVDPAIDEKEVKLSKALDNTLRLYNVYNFPNPFTNNTQFCFEVSNNVRLKIDIYSLGGRKVWSYLNENINSGYHSIEWNGKDFFNGEIANGVYLYKVEAFGNNYKASYIGKCAKYQ